MPVAKAEIAIANTPKRTTSNRAPGYFDQAYLSFATSFCRHLEAIPTSLTLKITSVFSPQPLYTFNLAHWMQCDGLKNRALGQRFLALKKSSEDITHLASSGFSEYQKDKNPNHFDTNIKLMSDLQPRWKRLIQECEVNAMTTSNDFDHETLNMIQKEAKSYEDRLQRNLLQFKSAKSYYSYQTAKKLRPVPEDSQAEIIFFNKQSKIMCPPCP